MALGNGDGSSHPECGYELKPENPDTWPSGVRLDPKMDVDSDLPICSREALGGHERCGLHLPPADRPDTFDAVEVITDHLEAVTDPSKMTGEPAGTANLVGIHLNTLEFKDIIESLGESRLTTIDLRFARIDGTLSFPRRTISQRIWLDGAAIGQLEAPRTTFKKEVSLDNSLIGDPDHSEKGSKEPLVLNLSNATVESKISLQDARISGNASMSEITSLPRLLGRNATITGLLVLDGTTVEDETQLASVQCEQLSAIQANLHQADLNGLSVLRAAKLGNIDIWGTTDDDIKLGKTTFGGRVTLNEATFHSETNLQSATFDGQLELEDAVFHGPVFLQEAQFHAPVEVTGAEFHATLHSSTAYFEEQLRFNRAEFERPAYFEDAVFGDHTHFDRAAFHDEAVFDDAEFKADCFFRATTDDQTTATGHATADASPTAAAESATVESDTESAPEMEREPVSDGGHTEPLGVFKRSVSLERTIVRGQADFRVFEESEAGTDSFSPSSDIAWSTKTVGGEFFAPEVTLSDAEMAGFTAGGKITITDADLTEANLRQADLQKAVAERASFSRANCFATQFQEARLHGTILEGTKIDDRTKFGDKVIYHTEAQQAVDPSTELTRLEKAISLYSQLETLARDNGQPSVARTMFVKRKNAQRRKMRLDDRPHSIFGLEISAESKVASILDGLDYFFATCKKYVMNYGESYWRVVGTSGGIILLLGLVFPLFDLEHSTVGQLGYQGSLGHIGQDILLGVLFSLSVFTTLGINQFGPGPFAEALAVIEAGIGTLMFGILLFVLQRRTVR